MRCGARLRDSGRNQAVLGDSERSWEVLRAPGRGLAAIRQGKAGRSRARRCLSWLGGAVRCFVGQGGPGRDLSDLSGRAVLYGELLVVARSSAGVGALGRAKEAQWSEAVLVRAPLCMVDLFDATRCHMRPWLSTFVLCFPDNSLTSGKVAVRRLQDLGWTARWAPHSPRT